MVTRKPRTAAPKVEQVQVSVPEASLPVRPKALVFISHDSRDADIAEAFANLLSDVSAGTLKSFRSSDKKGNTGIEFGAEWYTSIMSQLGDATDVVALLTARSIDRPWILYEAGVAKGKLETTVLGLALGIPLEKVSTGPFGQFQNSGDDEDSLTKLVVQLLQRNPDAAPREEAVRRQVKLFIETLGKLSASRPKKSAEPPEEQGVAKLFEEVKAMVRELPDRVDDRVRASTRRSGVKANRRLSPKLMEELLYRVSGPSGRTNNPASLLVILSFVRDEVPWIYELGLELYRAMRANDRAAVRTAHKELDIVMATLIHGPWSRDLFRDDEESYMLYRYVPEFIERAVNEFLSASAPRRRATLSSESNAGDAKT